MEITRCALTAHSRTTPQYQQQQQQQWSVYLTCRRCMQFWDAAGAAVALNRTLILPTFTCYCDELWYWSLEVKPSYGCRWPGARNQTLPFACPHDQLVNYLQLEDNPAKYGSPVRYRESTFLNNPRTPAAIKVCPPPPRMSPFTLPIYPPYGR